TRFSILTGIVFSTYLGGSSDEEISNNNGLILDSVNNVYLIGGTTSSNFPVTSNGHDILYNADWDVTVSKLSPDGSNLLYSTFLGSDFDDRAHFATIDSTNKLYVSGSTASTNFPTLYAFDNTHNGGTDIFITTFELDSTNPVINLNSPTNDTWIQNQGFIDLSISDDTIISQTLYNWDNNNNESLGFPYNISLIDSEGEHKLNVFAEDIAGSWTKKSFIFSIDKTGPVISLPSPNNASEHQSGTLLNFTIEDDLSNLDQILYRWNNSDTNTTFSSPFDLSIPAIDAAYSLQIYAKDLAGNWAAKVFLFISDNTPPQGDFFGVSFGSTIHIEDVHTIGIENITELNGLSRVEFLLNDESVLNTSSSPYRWIWTTTDVINGDYTVTIKVVDSAGNTLSQDFSVKVINPEDSPGDNLLFGLDTPTLIGIVIGGRADALFKQTKGQDDDIEKISKEFGFKIPEYRRHLKQEDLI
ncbi:MAG: Ig-like domain-containing protein, partial [Candidatus Kariarchaeaceae archaeon]